MKLKRIWVGLAIVALLILIVKQAGVITAVAGPVGALLVAGAVAVLAVIFILLVLLPVLGVMFAGVSLIILLLLLGMAISVPIALFRGHPITQETSDDGDGDKSSEVREMPAFDRLYVKGDMTLLVVGGGGGHAVAVKGDPDAVQALRSHVKGGLLTLRQSDDADTGQDIRVAVSAGKLKEFHVSGDVVASLQRLDSTTFNLDLEGPGQIEAAGRCGKLTIHMAGEGNLNARELACDDVTVVMDGPGVANVFAAKSLKVDITGPGQVTYAGSPAAIERHVAGQGSLSPE